MATRARILADYVSSGDELALKAPLASPTFTGTTTVSGDLVPSSPLSHRNMIINGAMQIDQRKNGAIATDRGATDDDYVTADRWREALNIGAGRITEQCVTDVTDLAGFHHALKIDCTTTGGAPTSSEYVIMKQRIEGFNLQQMEKGFSSAKPVTLSFWVKGTASRTYVVELRDTSSTARSASQQFSATTSWVKHTYTFPGDTGGDKIPNDNTHGLEVNFWLSAGSNFTSGSYTALTWANHTDANTAVGISGSGSGILTTTSDELHITGVQLELGSSATPFEHRSYGDELARCQRYYYTHLDGNSKSFGSGFYHSNSELGWYTQFPVTMRTTPALEHTDGTDEFIMTGPSNDYFSNIDIVLASTTGAAHYNANQASGTKGEAGRMQANASTSYIAYTAEL